MSAHDIMVLIAKPFARNGGPTAQEMRMISEAADALLAAGYRKDAANVTDVLAVAWDEGFDAGWDDAKDDGINDKWDSRTPNPYGGAA